MTIIRVLMNRIFVIFPVMQKPTGGQRLLILRKGKVRDICFGTCLSAMCLCSSTGSDFTAAEMCITGQTEYSSIPQVL